MSIKTVVLFFVAIALAFSQAKPASKEFTIDLSQKILDLDGNPVVDAVDKDSKPVYLTLGRVMVRALETSVSEDQGKGGLPQFERDGLAFKIYKKDKVTLTTEELTTIKDRIGQINWNSARVVGASWKLIQEVLDKK